MTDSRQRLDKWLWYARIVKSRTLAQKLIESGAVRVDGVKTSSPSRQIGAGAVLTFTLHERLRVLKVNDPGTRRGPAAEAQTLYEDMSPELPKKDPLFPGAAKRAPGAGRPTKKERRAVDALLRGEG